MEAKGVNVGSTFSSQKAGERGGDEIRNSVTGFRDRGEEKKRVKTEAQAKM